MNDQKSKPVYRQKKFVIPLLLIAVLVLGIFLVEPLLLKEINKQGAHRSEAIKIETEDLDIHLLKGSISLEGIKGTFKENDKEFLSIQEIETIISWSELFDGRILAHVNIDGLGLRHSKALMSNLEVVKKEIEELKKEQADEDKRDIPLNVASLSLKNSSITMEDYPKLKPDEAPHISQIEANVENLTPVESRPMTNFDFKAVLLGAGGVETQGQAKLLTDPIEWSVDGEIQKLKLSAANDFLRDKIPLTFKHGELDAYAEAISRDGKIEGYVKPFLKEMNYVGNERDFKGAKHWMIEIVSAIGTLILSSPDKDTVASLIPFEIQAEEVNVETATAIKETLKHGLIDKVERGIDHKYQLQD